MIPPEMSIDGDHPLDLRVSRRWTVDLTGARTVCSTPEREVLLSMPTVGG